MHCPDCGTVLTQIQMSATDQGFRCFKCGGFWLDSWAVNRLTSQSLVPWRRISAPVDSLREGRGMCPLDGLPLKRYTGESVPQQIIVKRCDRCGKWWFGGDSLFEFKPAQEIKIRYFQMWGLPAQVTNILLPVVAVIILALGIYLGMKLARSRQLPLIKAVERVIR